MNIRRVKWSYLNIKKQKLEWKEQYRVTRYELNDKNELVKVDNPVNCNPRKKLPKQLKEMLDKLLFND